jgi:uncharacterized protein YukE
MSELYAYDEGGAETAGDDLASIVAALEGTLDQLQGYVASVESQWNADEQILYRSVQTKWSNAATSVHEILAQMKTALGANTEQVRDMRSQVRSALSRN